MLTIYVICSSRFPSCKERSCDWWWGGVGIYLRQHISFTIVSMSSQPAPPDAGEHLFFELDLNYAKVLLGVYYSPSLRTKYFFSFENLIVNLSPSYSHTIIMGDFNTCLIKNDYRFSSLRRVGL